MFRVVKECVRSIHKVKCEKIANNRLNNEEKTVGEIKKMLQHFETYNFLKKSGSNIQFGVNIENLKERVRKEWLFSNLVLSDQPSFFVSSLNKEENFRSSFQSIKSLVHTPPFSLIEINCYMTYGKKFCHNNKMTPSNACLLVKNIFERSNGTVMKNLTFCSPQNAIEFFHKQQRDRKIWWRKFSAQPGRFHTTEVSSEGKSQFVEIQAEFPWGFETIETISYSPDISTSCPDDFEIKSNHKSFLPHIVTSETSLDKMTLTYLCDSYEGFNEEGDTEVLKFCRKLAPYKVAFIGQKNCSEITQNITGLVQLLAMKIRKCDISVLVLPDMCSASVEHQIARNDALGVPFSILLDENTLKDGIVAVRSRDTTLKEQSHVSLVVSHMEKLFKG